MALLVTKAKKDPNQNTFLKILSIGGNREGGVHWDVDTSTAIKQIEAGIESYYVNIDGHAARLVVGQHEGIKYLKTELDGEKPKTLLTLPER